MEILYLAALMLLVMLTAASAMLAVMVFRFTRARGMGKTDGAWVSSPMVLGITGGVLGLLIAAWMAKDAFGEPMKALQVTTWVTALSVFCMAGVAGGIAGIVGGAIVKRHRKAAGITMLAGAALSLITIFGPMLLICGGVLALVPTKAADKQQA